MTENADEVSLIDLIAFVKSARRRNPERDEEAEYNDGTQNALYTDTNKGRVHLIIYAFIALSLVQFGNRDVCATAVYQLEDRFEVYVSRNDGPDDRFRQVTDELVCLIRDTATNTKPDKGKFIRHYFDLIRRHCGGKLKSRISALQSELTKHTGRIGKFVIPSLPLLKERITNYGASDPPKFHMSWGDAKAASLSPKGNLYDGLLLALAKVERSAVDPTSTVNYVNLSRQCSVVGESTYVRSLNQHPELYDLIENIKKVGQYYRGARYLFDRIIDPKYQSRFKNITVHMVDSPDRIKHRPPETDWYALLSRIEQNRTGSAITISKGRFQAEYGGIVNYEKKQEYTPHCECNLVSQLISRNIAPTTLGTSKLCCELCSVWIDGVNDYLGKLGETRRWTVGSTRGKIYFWEPPQSTSPAVMAGNAAVRVYLLKKVRIMVDNCKQLEVLESPSEMDALSVPPDSPFLDYTEDVMEETG